MSDQSVQLFLNREDYYLDGFRSWLYSASSGVLKSRPTEKHLSFRSGIELDSTCYSLQNSEMLMRQFNKRSTRMYKINERFKSKIGFWKYYLCHLINKTSEFQLVYTLIEGYLVLVNFVQIVDFIELKWNCWVLQVGWNHLQVTYRPFSIFAGRRPPTTVPIGTKIPVLCGRWTLTVQRYWPMLSIYYYDP